MSELLSGVVFPQSLPLFLCATLWEPILRTVIPKPDVTQPQGMRGEGGGRIFFIFFAVLNLYINIKLSRDEFHKLYKKSNE